MRPDQIQRLGMTRTFQHTWLWREMTVVENLLVAARDQFGPNRLLALLRPDSRKEEQQRIVEAYAILDLLEIATDSGASILMSTHNFPLIQPRKKRFIELNEGRMVT